MMYIEMNIKVGEQSYRISKLDKYFGNWEFYKVTDTDRNLCEYMGSCISSQIGGELSKLLGKFIGEGNGEMQTLLGGK